MKFKNPDTRVLKLPYSLYTSPEAAIIAINKVARQRGWERSAHFSPVDERVVWTIHEDHLELFYRANPAPTTGG